MTTRPDALCSCWCLSDSRRGRPATPSPAARSTAPSPATRPFAALDRGAPPPGPAAVAALLTDAPPEGSPQRERWERTLDAVCAQRDCAASGLYWYTDLDLARAKARRAGKPILSLRLLGHLDEDVWCANSRFFRTVSTRIPGVRELRDRFVLHWASERPVPRLSIDFGDGRRLEGTITGNSVHYVLDSRGRVVDAPGSTGRGCSWIGCRPPRRGQGAGPDRRLRLREGPRRVPRRPSRRHHRAAGQRTGRSRRASCPGHGGSRRPPAKRQPGLRPSRRSRFRSSPRCRLVIAPLSSPVSTGRRLPPATWTTGD